MCTKPLKKRTIAAVLSLAMMLGLAPAGIPQAGTPFSVTAQAAKKKAVKKKKKTKKTKKTKKKAYKENPRLSKMKISLQNKKMTTVKVSGTKKGISVSTSDKSIAAVSKSGKYAFRIKAAKKKKGIAVIRVKTSSGYRYVFVQVGGRTNMSGKTRAWAQAAGFISIPSVQPSTSAQIQAPAAQIPSTPVQMHPQQSAVTPPSSTGSNAQSGNGSGSGNASSSNKGYYYNGSWYTTAEGAERARAQDLYLMDLLGTNPGYKYSEEELELLKKYDLLNGNAYTQYEAIQDQKKNGSFYAVLDQYRDYCKNYDKQILITKCGMTTSELANPDRLSDARKLQILNKLCTYIEYNIPYIGGDPSKPHGGENEYFFYPNLWQTLTDQGYVSSRKLGYGWSCNGTAGKMMEMSYEWLHTKMYWVSMPEFSNGNGMHGGAAIFLDGKWYIYQPGYTYNYDGTYCDDWDTVSPYTGPVTNESNNAFREFYARCVKAKNDDAYMEGRNYPYWAYDYEKGWYHT